MIVDRPVYGLSENERIVPLNVDVPSQPIVQEKVQLWKKGFLKHQQEEMGGLIDWLVARIDNISFPVFKEKLTTVAQGVRHLLPEAVIFIEPGKSQEWVSHLLAVETDFHPYAYIRVGEKKANCLANTIDNLPSDFNKECLKNVILIDDASYTGNQMVDHIVAANLILRDRGIIPTFHLVVPYITRIAKERVQIELPVEHGVNVQLFFQQEIPTVKELVDGGLDEATQERVLKLLWKGRADFRLFKASSATLTYFDHKVPNYQSFADHIAHLGLVPSFQPPYKTTI